MQYKKNLYKILFIAILLGFTISLAGCNWLSLGLLNIFDPQSQIRLSELNINDDGTVDMKIFTLNQVEFVVSGFEFDYYRGTSRVTSLDRTASAYYYVAPSSSPGEAGTLTPITDLLLYSTAVLDYVKSNSAFNEITTDLYIVGTDGAGHDLKVKVASGLSALGVDNTPPIANINYEPINSTWFNVNIFISTVPLSLIFNSLNLICDWGSKMFKSPKESQLHPANDMMKPNNIVINNILYKFFLYCKVLSSLFYLIYRLNSR